MEIWKGINRFGNEYEVSSEGRCRSVFKVIEKSNGKKYTRISKILKPAKFEGYFKCAFSYNGKLITKPIHRIVAETFIENPLNKKEVNHINGNKEDNSIANLEWVSHSENIKHAYNNKLIKPKRGSLNGMSKLNKEQVQNIRNEVVGMGRYYGRKELALKYGISECRIKEIINRRKNNWQDV